MASVWPLRLLNVVARSAQRIAERSQRCILCCWHWTRRWQKKMRINEEKRLRSDKSKRGKIGDESLLSTAFTGWWMQSTGAHSLSCLVAASVSVRRPPRTLYSSFAANENAQVASTGVASSDFQGLPSINSQLRRSAAYLLEGHR